MTCWAHSMLRGLISCWAVFLLLFFCSISSYAETPAPDVHWGALAYPDQGPVFEIGLTLNRFTEFNEEEERFNDIRETIGINQGTLSWTEHWEGLKHWSTNLTVGAGPTRDQPTRFLQNEVVHETIWGFKKVPVREKRRQTDVMVTGSLTRWISFGSHDRQTFAGLGVATGSLYHEVFGRLGMRRWSPIQTFYEPSDGPQPWWVSVLAPLRFSGMYRYARIWEGAAFRALAPESHVAQGSISYGWLRDDHFPLFEIEVGVTLDSGIFVDTFGDSLEERFWTFAIRAHPFRIETWNDQINRKDFGPTYGIRLMMDLYAFLPDSWQWRKAIES